MSNPQQVIRSLFNGAVPASLLLGEFNLYNSSVEQKLWSAEYYCKSLNSLDINDYLRPQNTSVTQSYGNTYSAYALLDTVWLCKDLNRLIDGFFMNIMSALDTLAHEIFVIYEFSRHPDKIYISTAKTELQSAHPHSSISGIIDSLLRTTWYLEYKPYRTCTTHESLIRYDNISFKFDPINNQFILSNPITLPDDPKVRPYTYAMNRFVGPYCTSVLTNTQYMVSAIYGSILLDMNHVSNQIPIQPF